VSELNPLLRWDYVVAQRSSILAAVAEHLQLTLMAVSIGLLLASVLAASAMRWRVARPTIGAATAALYTVPAVAFFGLLVPITGLTRMTALIPLVAYSLVVLVNAIIDGFDQVPEAVEEAAVAMGMTLRRRVLGVRLPLAIPVIVAGLRVTTVTTVGLVTLAAIVGQGGLGRLILDGLRRAFWTPLTVGALLSITLALSLDALFVLLERHLAPSPHRRRHRATARRWRHHGLRPGPLRHPVAPPTGGGVAS
jgi:osmoprotectant transport system permease protein